MGPMATTDPRVGFGTAEETNERFRYLLEHGQTGLSTAFDMPTLMGYDSDHPRSLGEVGREGVAVDSLDDMETLFAGIPLGEVSTSMTINSPAAILLAFYACVGEEQGVERARRLVLRRAPDERARTAGRSLLRPDPQARRRRRGDQGELLPARDRGGVVPVPGRGRGEAAGRRRRQPLRAGGREADRDPAHRPGARAQAGGAR